jgi:hypothetical protein
MPAPRAFHNRHDKTASTCAIAWCPLDILSAGQVRDQRRLEIDVLFV